MEKKEILYQLEQLMGDPSVDTDTRDAIEEAIKIIKKSRASEHYIRAIELLLKALGLGLNMF